MPNADLPDEVIRDILSRLPVKSLLQFRCVSKHWRGLIADTHFIKSHLKKVSTHHQILVPTLPLLSLSYNASPNDTNASIELDCPFLKPTTSIKILGSCNGLVCLIDATRDMIIYNPSTRRHFKPYQSPQQVLHCSNRIEFVYGFGCGSNPNDMRVVRFPRFARDSEYTKFKVCGVGCGSRVSGVVAYKNYDFIDTVGTFLNGSLHWLAHHSSNNDENRVVASFNISKETFRDLCLPPQQGSLPYYILGVLQGCLSAVCDDMNYTDVDVWLMTEYGVVKSWTKFMKIPLNTGIENISYMMPLRLVNENEILAEIDLQSFVIYNVKKRRFSRVKTACDLKWFGDAAIYVESLLPPQVLCVLY